MAQLARDRTTFQDFYAKAYRDEHRHPANLAMHIVGVFAGLGVLGASITIWPSWTALSFPFAHVLPGLIGHRMFERNEAVGDVRVTRRDFPIWWFLAANHAMAAHVLTRRW